ncbi:bactofilin family protein [Thauera sp.]|uniref:bactofilin family protein n=1 Tax=Thauera sp. TaxID=1905334 RepID=UPI0039E36F31
MFNKPSLFPKQPEPAAGQRAAPARPATMGSSTFASGVPASSDPVQEVAQADAAKPAAAPADVETGGSRLIVGPDVKLKGAEILDCDTLVVEGRVEATMDSRVIRIAENGSYEGTVGIDVAEIHGRFEGELTARQQLIIHATGRVSGKIRYGKILIEEGGEVSGDVQSLARAGTKEGLRAVESRSNDSKPIAAVAG